MDITCCVSSPPYWFKQLCWVFSSPSFTTCIHPMRCVLSVLCVGSCGRNKVVSFIPFFIWHCESITQCHMIGNDKVNAVFWRHTCSSDPLSPLAEKITLEMPVFVSPHDKWWIVVVTHDYSCRTGKVFLSQPGASLDQWSVSANPRPHLLSSPPPSPSRLLLPSSLWLFPEGLLFTAECLLLSAVCDRAHQ